MEAAALRGVDVGADRDKSTRARAAAPEVPPTVTHAGARCDPALPGQRPGGLERLDPGVRSYLERQKYLSDLFADGGRFVSVDAAQLALIAEVMDRVREVRWRTRAEPPDDHFAREAETLIKHALWALCGVPNFRDRLSAAFRVLAGGPAKSGPEHDDGIRVRAAVMMLLIANECRGRLSEETNAGMLRDALVDLDPAFASISLDHFTSAIRAAAEGGAPTGLVADLAIQARAFGVKPSATRGDVQRRFNKVLERARRADKTR